MLQSVPFSAGSVVRQGFALMRRGGRELTLLMLTPALLSVCGVLDSLGATRGAVWALPVSIAGWLGVAATLWAVASATRYLHHMALGQPVAPSRLLALASARDLLLAATLLVTVALFLASFLALVVPCVYLFNYSYVMLVAAVVERRYLIGWLPAALALGRRHWWQTAEVNAITSVFLLVPLVAAACLWFPAMGVNLTFDPAAPLLLARGAAAVISPLALAGAVCYVATLSVSMPLVLALSVACYVGLQQNRATA